MKTLSDYIAAYSQRGIGPTRPFLIAEAGVNHEGSMEIARRLISDASEGGADAIKFQTYRADTLAARESPAYWDLTKETTRTQHELFSKYDGFWKDEYEALKTHCDSVGIEFLSTPFDLESASFLADLMGVVKIASADITNLPFVEALASLGKPIVLSTGASTVAEIAEAVDVIEAHGNPLVLMHCILNYPAAREDANLGMLIDIRRRFPEAVPGYSDHTMPDPEMSVVTTAVLLGAAVIEKHFTHDKTLPGNDHYHAMDRADLSNLVARLDGLFALIGSTAKTPIPSEAAARAHARRSLVAARSIAVGATITPDDLTWKRPASGISPRDIDRVTNRRARRPIEADEILDWAMLE